MDTLIPIESHALQCSQYLMKVEQALPLHFMEEDDESENSASTTSDTDTSANSVTEDTSANSVTEDTSVNSAIEDPSANHVTEGDSRVNLEPGSDFWTSLSPRADSDSPISDTPTLSQSPPPLSEGEEASSPRSKNDLLVLEIIRDLQVERKHFTVFMDINTTDEDLDLEVVTLEPSDIGEPSHQNKVEDCVVQEEYIIYTEGLGLHVNIVDQIDPYAAAIQTLKKRTLEGSGEGDPVLVIKKKNFPKNQGPDLGCDSAAEDIPLVVEPPPTSTPAKGQKPSKMPRKGRRGMGRHARAIPRNELIDKQGAECDICHKTYVHLPNLARHKASVHAQARYSCDLCGAIFTRSVSLKSHRRRCEKRV